MNRVIFWIYNLLFPLVFVLMLPGYLRRMVRRGNYRRHFGQRLGTYSREVRAELARARSPVWVQAVSVGEMLVALKLIAALRAIRPGVTLVLTTTTTTGYQLARERAPGDIPVLYTPIDLRLAVRRAFEAIRPAQIVIVDGGLWPNHLLEARRRNIPVTLANARLSPRSERRFRRFRFLARSMFALLDRVCVPEAADVERWQALGVARERITDTGSIKYDDADAETASSAPEAEVAAAAAAVQREAGATPQAVLRHLGVPDGAPVLLAGSTHPGEERLLAEVLVELRRRFPDLLLIIAPRHVERAKEILAALEPLNLRIVARTDTLLDGTARDREEKHGGCANDAGRAIGLPFDVFVLDTTGELNAWYAVATVVFIGKSLTTVGGQNPAEAIAAGKPVLFGPHMENFESLATQLLCAAGAFQVADRHELQERIADLLTDQGKRDHMSARARALLLTHQGAARRTAELVLTTMFRCK